MCTLSQVLSWYLHELCIPVALGLWHYQRHVCGFDSLETHEWIICIWMQMLFKWLWIKSYAQGPFPHILGTECSCFYLIFAVCMETGIIWRTYHTITAMYKFKCEFLWHICTSLALMQHPLPSITLCFFSFTTFVECTWLFSASYYLHTHIWNARTQISQVWNNKQWSVPALVTPLVSTKTYCD